MIKNGDILSNITYRVMSSLLLIITAPYIIHKFGVEDFGRLQILIQWTLTFALLDFGISSAIINNIKIQAIIKLKLFRTLTFYILLVFTFSLLLAIGIYLLFDSLILLCISLAIVHIYSIMIFSLASTNLMLSEYQKYYNLGILISALCIFLFIDQFSSYEVVYFIWMSPFIVGSIIALAKTGLSYRCTVSLKRLKIIYFSVDGHKFFYLTLISVVSFSLDHFIIAYCLGYEDVTEFTLHSKIVTPFLMLFTAGHLVFWGTLNNVKLNRTEREYNQIVKLYVYKLTVIYIVSLFLLFLVSEPLLNLISAGKITYDLFLTINIILFSTLNVFGGILVVLLSLDGAIDIQITQGLKAMFLNIFFSLILVFLIGTAGPIVASNIALVYYYGRLLKEYYGRKLLTV